MIEAGAARPAGTTVFDWPEFAWLTWDEVEEGEALVDELRRAGLEVWLLLQPASGDFLRTSSALKVRDPGRVPCITSLDARPRVVDDEPYFHPNCRSTYVPFEPWHHDYRAEKLADEHRIYRWTGVRGETMDDIRRIVAT